ncbi:MAG: 16S rRNA (cytosine(1402)-N(4))-methyltransferase RsmH [Steroidobacteraceae bacterium]
MVGLHEPVLVDAAVAALVARPDGLYIDATFGRGGHTQRLLAALSAEGRVLALDRDPQAIDAGAALCRSDDRLELVHAPFAELREVLSARAPGRSASGILFDLGLSSPQLDTPVRGFSFSHDGPLDMRMDPTRGEPLSAWLARVQSRELARVIAELGEERFAKRIAAAIVAARERAPIATTRELASIVAGAVPRREAGKHPATRTFQALRIAINDELAQLRQALAAALSVLESGGRLVVISFHSLENRIVKNFIRDHSRAPRELAALPVLPPQAQPVLRPVGRKLFPDAAEIARNPRARSAVLRAAEKL